MDTVYVRFTQLNAVHVCRPGMTALREIAVIKVGDISNATPLDREGWGAYFVSGSI